MINFFRIAITLAFWLDLGLAQVANEHFCQKSTNSTIKSAETCRLSKNYELSFTKSVNENYDLSHNYYIFSDNLEAQILRVALNGRLL
jgi:hypothetical protein